MNLREFLLGDDPQTNLSERDIEEYSEVLAAAFGIHIEREHVRNGLWKQYPASAQAQQVKIKADRIVHTLDLMKDDRVNAPDLIVPTVNEIYDIINYSVFTARLLTGKV